MVTFNAGKAMMLVYYKQAFGLGLTKRKCFNSSHLNIIRVLKLRSFFFKLKAASLVNLFLNCLAVLGKLHYSESFQVKFKM